MVRPPRIDFPDALCHVTARGNGRTRIFFTDADRNRFLDQLQDNVATAAVRLYAFVLMENHFHLLVRTPRANLSQFRQRAASKQNWSRTTRIFWPLRGTVVQSLAVDGKAAVPGLHARVPSRRRWSERRLSALRTGGSQDADVAYPRSVYPIVEVDAAVAAHFGLDTQELRRHGHSADAAKFLAVELACRLTGATQREIGEHYGGITSAAVSTIRRKIRDGEYPAELVDQMLRKPTRGKLNT